MRAIQFVFIGIGAGIGVFYPFTGVILQSRGLDPAEIGFVQALAALAFTIAVPVWGHVADAMIGRTGALAVAAAGSALAVLGFAAPEVAPIAAAAMLVGFAAFESALSPLADALAINALADQPRRYGRVRLLSSVGFAIPTIAVGFLYDRTGYRPAPIFFAAIMIGLVAVARFVPDVPRLVLSRHGGGPGDDGSGRERRGGRFLRRPGGGAFAFALRLQPRLGRVLAALFLAHVGILAGFTFLSLRLVELGAGPSSVALSAGVSALAEIPAMAGIARIVPRTGLRALLAFSMLLYGACLASWAVLADPGLIIATRIASGIAFSGVTIGAVMTIGALLPDRLQATGQGLYQTVAFGAASVLANAAGGVIFGSAGALPLFLGCAVLSSLGALLAWRALPPRDHAIDRPELPGGRGGPGLPDGHDAAVREPAR